MKLLWLATSNEAEGYLPEEERIPFIVKARLAELLETKVAIEVRAVWPNRRLPSLVESWMAKHEPDLVLLQPSSCSSNYASVPLMLERKLGRLGKPFANAGLKAADIGWLSSQPLFHAGRRLLQRTVGGATHFEPEEVLSRFSACARIILRSEATALLVRGPRGANDYYSTARQRRHGEARRRFVSEGLQDLCNDLHVTFDGLDSPRYEKRVGPRVGDRVHLAAPENIVAANDITQWLLKAWTQLHPEHAGALAKL